MLPILVIDAYLDDRGGAFNFERILAGRPLVVVRTIRDPIPLDATAFSALLVSGSAASVLEAPPWVEPTRALLRDALDERVPVLGICFGHQLLAEAAFGVGTVRRARERELGWVEIERLAPDPLLDALPRRFPCFASHLDEVGGVPDGMRVLARSERCAVQAFRVADLAAWGVQFHPEMERAEAEQIVRSGLAQQLPPGRALRAILAEAGDTSGLGRALVGRFLALGPDEH